jgi:hypothetical protein
VKDQDGILRTILLPLQSTLLLGSLLASLGALTGTALAIVPLPLALL